MYKNSLKSKKDRGRKTSLIKQDRSIAILRLHYKFWILISILVLAGISVVLRVETPVVWTFLYGIGGWAALTTNPGSPLR